MAKYLVVGLPGIGKSTLALELLRRGYDALDADDDSELSTHRHEDSGLMKSELSSEEAASGKYHWSWNGDRLTAMLGNYSIGTHFILGNAANIKDFYPLFDRVFALVTDDETLTQRITTRGHGYGTERAEMDKIHSWNQTFKEVEIERGATIIDASTTPHSIADKILELCNAD